MTFWRLEIKASSGWCGVHFSRFRYHVRGWTLRLGRVVIDYWSDDVPGRRAPGDGAARRGEP